MPGENLTRIEAAGARARSSTVHDYDVALDLTTRPRGLPQCDARSCASPRTEGAVDVHRPDHRAGALASRSTASRSTRPTVSDGVRIQLAGLAAENELDRRRRRPLHATPARACTASSTPSTTRSYLYTQFEVPDSRRVFAVFEQPDLKATFRSPSRRPTHWEVVSNSPTPEPTTPGEGAGPGRFEPTPRISSLHHRAHRRARTRSCATSSRAPTAASSRSASSAARASAQYLDADYIFEKTRQGFAYYEAKFDYPYPFAKYDQLFVPEFNAGAMENAGAVTFTESYVFRSQGDRRRSRSAASSRSCTSSPTCGSATSSP